MSVLKRYIFWTYERGSFHYDVMVTLILLFLFVSPRFINFKATPVFVYTIPAGEVHGATGDAAIRSAILAVVQPIAGGVSLEKYVAVMDSKGHVAAYNATVYRVNP